MVELRESEPNEVQKFVELESAEDASKYVISYSADRHLDEMSKDHTLYLSIYNGRAFSGFIILALDGTGSVEFRRIVVASKGKGIGQAAINKVEEYCMTALKRNRVWLDVFESNLRGQHIYKKLGYKQFKIGEFSGRRLTYYEKML